MNSLPLFPLAISYLTRFYWENRCLQILRNTKSLNSYLGFFRAQQKVFFAERGKGLGTSLALQCCAGL